MNNKRRGGEKRQYDLITAELSALYEISSLSFSDSEEKLVEEAVEKAARLFGMRYFALFTGEKGKNNRRLVASWGFRKEEDVRKKMKQNKSNQFHFVFKEELGELFMEQAHPIVNKEKRLYTIFARYLENALLTARNIAQRKQAEKALRESEEKFRGFTEKSLVGIYLIQNGVFKYVNPMLAEIFGYTVEELIDKKGPKDLTLPEDWPIVEENLQKRLSGEVQSIHYNFRGMTKNKEVIWVEVYGSRTMYQEGPAVIGTLLNITEQKRLQEQLVQSEKLAAVGELVSGVAHEINNPLTGILGFSQLIMESNLQGIDQDIRKGLELIYTEALRLKKIVSNLLSFARKKKPEKKEIRINEVIDTVLSLREYELKVNNIRVVRNFSRNLPPVMADAQQMEQVFLNIINNAQEAMYETNRKGTLTITTYLKSERGTEEMLTVDITNDGPPIPRENLPKIFEPFFTTKPPGKGTGLGLSVSYGIVKQHGGDIRVRNLEGKGVVFSVELPALSLSPTDRRDNENEKEN